MASLSMNEKRYFTSHTKSKNALQLFNLINDQPQETSSLSPFSSREKNYLFNSILRSLREFHSEMSVNRILDNYVHEIDILINKELFDIAIERIKQGEKLAVQFQKLAHQILFIRLRRKVTIYMGKGDVEQIRIFYDQIQTLNHMVSVEEQLEKLMIFFKQEAYIRQNVDIENEIEEIVNKLPDNLKEKVMASQIFLRTQAFNYFHKGDLPSAYGCYTTLIRDFSEQKPWLSNSALDRYTQINYMSILHGFLSVLKAMDKGKEYLEVIEILKSTKGISQRENSKSFVNMSISVTDYFIIKNETKLGLNFIQQHKKEIDSISFEPDRMELLLFNITYICFIEKQFREAHRYVFKYVSYANPRYKFVYKTANYIYMLIQFEMGKIDFAIHLLNKYVKKLKNKNEYDQYDEIFEHFFKAYYILNSQAEVQGCYKEFAKILSMDSIRNDPANLNRYFNFKRWMESKLFHRPFSH